MTGQFLVELKFHDGVSEKTFRAATGKGFKTQSGETPSRAVYEPRLIDCGSIQSFLFNNATTAGFTTLGAGKIVFNNADGVVADTLLNQGTDGRDIIIRENDGLGIAYPSNFITRFSGISQTLLQINSTTASTSVVSSTGKFYDLPLQPLKYGGDNDGGSIFFEGTDEDIGGSPKPILWGFARNFSVPLVNESLEIYQLSSEPVDIIDVVYAGRAVITAGIERASLSDLRTIAPAGGQYDFYLGDYLAAAGNNDRGCYIRFGTTPGFKVTVEATEGWKNQALHSEEFDDADWVKSNITIDADSIESPDGAITADTLTATSANGTCLQTVTASSDQFIYGMWLKRKTGTGDIDITVDGGSTFETKTLTTEWQLFDVTPQTTTNPQFGVRIVTSGDEVYAYGAILAQRDVIGPYIKTTTVAVYNNHIPAIIWKIMNEKGQLLDAQSITEAQKDFPGPAQYWQGLNEEKTGIVIDILAESGYFFWTDRVDETFIIGQFKVPTAAEVVNTVNDKTLLGRQKIKRITSRDQNKGVPIKRANVGHDQNYTIMSDADVTGVGLGDLAYLEQEFRVINDETTADIQFLTAPDWNVDTKLQLKADAETIGAHITSLQGVPREIIEIKLPLAFSVKSDDSILEENDVIQVDSKVYRIIGKLSRFPKAVAGGSNQLTTQAFIFQAWGGVAV